MVKMNIIAIVFIILINFIVSSQSFCLGLLCSCVPWVAKSCCGVFRRCCIQYQAWLGPLIGTEDVFSEYIDAVAGEAMSDAIPEIIEGFPDGTILAVNDPSQVNRFPLYPRPQLVPRPLANA